MFGERFVLGVGKIVARGCRSEQNNANAFLPCRHGTGSSGVFEGNRAAGNASFGRMFQVEKDWQRKDNRCFDNPLQADEPRQVGCLTLLLGWCGANREKSVAIAQRSASLARREAGAAGIFT